MNNKLFWSLAFLIVSGVVFGITIRNFVGNSSYNQTAALNLAVSTTSLSVGDKVVTISDAEVKKNPNTSTVSGTQTKGSSGVVTGIYGTRSKTNVKSEIWINVDYDSGVDGWTMEGKLEKKDEIPPTLVMLSPKGNISVSGTVHFKLDVSDNRGIDHVDFIIDGVTVKTLTQAPYEIYVGGSDPSAVPYPNTSKTHKFAARAVDTSGNATDVDPIVTLISPVPVREGGVTYIKFTFGIADNYTYIVEKTISLASPIAWVDVNTLPVAERGRTTDNGDGTLSYLAPAVGTMGFFRVKALDPQSVHNLIITKTGNGRVTAPGGIDCGPLCQAGYTANEQVTLTAVADSGSRFDGWQGGGCVGIGPCTVTIPNAQNMAVGAPFSQIIIPPKTYNLTINKFGTGNGSVSSIPVGTSCGTSCLSFPANSSVTLSAQASVGSTFAGWAGACTNPTGNCVVYMNNNRLVQATFSLDDITPPSVIITSPTNNSTVNTPSITVTGTASDASGVSSVTVNAINAQTTNNYANWTSNITLTKGANTITFRATDTRGNAGNTIVNVTYTPLVTTYTLTINKTGTGGGTVTGPGGINCGTTCSGTFAIDTEVRLEATSNTGSVFDRWAGACTGTGDCVVTMSQVRQVTAIFYSTVTNENVILAPGENFCTKYRNESWIGSESGILSHLLPESDEERLNLEYVNRARMNPELGARILRDTMDPDILTSYAFYGVNTNMMYSQISALSPVGPLATHIRLRASSQKHACDQFINKFQNHIGSDGSNPGLRINNAGYPWNTYGENINAYGKTVFHGHAGLEVDFGVPNLGHRLIIHNGNYRETGMAVVLGDMDRPITGPDYGGVLINENYANRWGLSPYITGVVYFDLNGNNFYDIGEGIGGVEVATVDPQWGLLTTLTEKSGGYNLQVSTINRDYSVTFDTNRTGVLVPGNSVRTVNVPNSNVNVKLDYTPSYTPITVTGPSILPVNSSGVFSFGRIPFATSYELESSALGVPALEGAETPRGMGNMRMFYVPDNTEPVYPKIVNDIKASGNSSFHMVMPGPPTGPPVNDYVLEFTKLFIVKADSELRFRWRLGWATASQVFRAQVSDNDGVTWTNLFSQAGDSTAGNTGTFATRNISLSAYDGKLVKIRFIYDHTTGGSYYYQTGTGMGVYLDDIQVINADELVESTLSTIPNGSSFNWSSPTIGSHILRVRGTIGQRKFPFSAIKTITVN